MASHSGPADRQLAIHPQRNLPSSLLTKRCKETFARILEEHEESEGHLVKWALITESGRANKMLLISVLGEHDPFPFCRTVGCGSEVDVEDEIEAEAGTEPQSENNLQAEESIGGGNSELYRGDCKEAKQDPRAKLEGNDGNKPKRDTAARLDSSKKDEAIPIPAITETYTIMSSSDGEEIPEKNQITNTNDESVLSEATSDPRKNKKQPRKRYTGTETYPIVATIMDGKLEWMCDDPKYDGYDDMTTYFKKDGLSMVDGITFHDRIKERKRAAVAELVKAREAEEQRILAKKNAWKAEKKARKKAQKMQKAELAPTLGGVAPDIAAAANAVAEDSADRKREKARAKRLRQKQRRDLAEEMEAVELEAEEEVREKATRNFYKQHMGKEMETRDDVEVIDPSTPEGALALARAKKHQGSKMFRVAKLEDRHCADLIGLMRGHTSGRS